MKAAAYLAESGFSFTPIAGGDTFRVERANNSIVVADITDIAVIDGIVAAFESGGAVLPAEGLESPQPESA